MNGCLFAQVRYNKATDIEVREYNSCIYEFKTRHGGVQFHLQRVISCLCAGFQANIHNHGALKLYTQVCCVISVDIYQLIKSVYISPACFSTYTQFFTFPTAIISDVSMNINDDILFCHIF